MGWNSIDLAYLVIMLTLFVLVGVEGVTLRSSPPNQPLLVSAPICGRYTVIMDIISIHFNVNMAHLKTNCANMVIIFCIIYVCSDSS